ncbi:sugar phosphate nucleotidyltransferase [Treponema pectinovorum]|uniref:sugar phosphate nucleotidyltransferase n=1 Tax=Treponema pectinovorum TaxID=164 RepID=UPI0011F3063D|nr:sugar phosphate nucleotidyltransferase [Treponema pectinovorum]
MKPTLLVLAAGMGSRYGGVKQIDTVGKNGECLLDYSAYDAMQSGFKKVVYIIRKDIEKDFREKLFDRVARNFNAEYVFQSQDSLLTSEEYALAQKSGRTKPWGTLHAVLCAQKELDSPFAVINADDYYGRQAFETLGKYLSSIENSSTEHAMVGYILGKTMSRNGSVSRGICTVENGELKTITENTKIYYTGKDFSGNEIISELDGKKYSLTGEETVSMNLFGFTPQAFKEFERYWQDFKATGLTQPKAEALLPVAASSLIKEGKGKIKVFKSEESWFGMTYAQDKQVVKDAIAKKIATGYYPEKLWEK